MKHSIKEEISGVVIFVAVVWGVFLLNLITPMIELNQFGILPRTLKGLIGIVASPFLHANLGHILSNTVPLTVLLILLAGSRTRTWETVAELIVFSGGLLWLFGRSSYHVGASGLVYALIAYLIVSGFLEKRIIPLFISLFVAFFYGGSLIGGVLPQLGSHISWEGHLLGAVAAVFLAFIHVGRKQQTEANLPLQ